jgi:hypothetical protein
VGEPVCKKEWWGGLVTDLRAWLPNRVCTSRVTWVGLFGIPPHAWGESNFRKIVSSCGEFVDMDAETRNLVRFDLARVKIRAPLCGKIDFAVNLFIQGAKFLVRVLEEGGGLFRDDGGVDDQLRRSVVGSSCASAGQASVRAELEGLDDAETDSNGSELGQQSVHRELEVGTRSKGYNQEVGEIYNKAGGTSDDVVDIPSIEEQVMMVTTDNNNLGMQSVVRGDVFGGQVDRCVQVAVEEHVTSLVVGEHVVPEDGLGRVSGGPDPQRGSDLGIMDGVVEQEGFLGLDANLIPSLPYPPHQVVPPKKSLIENFDLLVNTSRSKQVAVVFSDLSTSNKFSRGDVISSQNKQGRSNRPPTPFHPLLGPKCLRFAEAINNSMPTRKIRRSKGSVLSSMESQANLSESVGGEVGLDRVPDSVEGVGVEQCCPEHHHDSQGLSLSVCLPFPVAITTDSGLRQLLNEDSIKDVEGFLEAHDSPTVQKLEAQKLLCNQQEVGINFDAKEALPINRMVNMEVRDREKSKLDLEANGFQ